MDLDHDLNQHPKSNIFLWDCTSVRKKNSLRIRRQLLGLSANFINCCPIPQWQKFPSKICVSSSRSGSQPKCNQLLLVAHLILQKISPNFNFLSCAGHVQTDKLTHKGKSIITANLSGGNYNVEAICQPDCWVTDEPRDTNVFVENWLAKWQNIEASGSMRICLWANAGLVRDYCHCTGAHQCYI